MLQQEHVFCPLGGSGSLGMIISPFVQSLGSDDYG